MLLLYLSTIQSYVRNGSFTYSSTETVLLRLHPQSCAPILSLLSSLAYITLTGSAEVTFSGRRNKRGSEFGTGDVTMCLVFQTLSNPLMLNQNC